MLGRSNPERAKVVTINVNCAINENRSQAEAGAAGSRESAGRNGKGHFVSNSHVQAPSQHMQKIVDDTHRRVEEFENQLVALELDGQGSSTQNTSFQGLRN